MSSEQLIVTKNEEGKYVVSPRYKPAGTRICDNFAEVVYEILNYSEPAFLPETSIHLQGLSMEEESVVRELKIILQNTSNRIRNLALEEGRIKLNLEKKVSE